MKENAVLVYKRYNSEVVYIKMIDFNEKELYKDCYLSYIIDITLKKMCINVIELNLTMKHTILQKKYIYLQYF